MTTQTQRGSSAAPTATKVSYEEFLASLDDESPAEWVNGEVVSISPISDEHQLVASFLLTLLKVHVEHHSLGVVLYEPFQMKTGPDLPGRSPDVLFVSEEHRARIHSTFLDGPADVAIEVISPESRGRDRGEKFYEYEQGGVTEYWLIDPQRKQAEFHHRGEDGIYKPVPIAADAIFRSEVLPSLWLNVAWLWQRPLPKLLDVLKQWGLVP